MARGCWSWCPDAEPTIASGVLIQNKEIIIYTDIVSSQRDKYCFDHCVYYSCYLKTDIIVVNSVFNRRISKQVTSYYYELPIQW